MTEPVVGMKFGTIDTKLQEMKNYATKIGGKVLKLEHNYIVADKNGKDVGLSLSVVQDKNRKIYSAIYADIKTGEFYEAEPGTNGKFNKFFTMYPNDRNYEVEDKNKNGIMDKNEINILW